MIPLVTGAVALMALSGAGGAGPAAGSRRQATHVVRLQANRFQPAETRAAPGDTVRFVNGQGGPHNVEFIGDSMTQAARRSIDAAMPAPKIRTLSSGLLIVPDETYSVVVPDLPAGRYAFLCVPHAAAMRGALVVR